VRVVDRGGNVPALNGSNGVGKRVTTYAGGEAQGSDDALISLRGAQPPNNEEPAHSWRKASWGPTAGKESNSPSVPGG